MCYFIVLLCHNCKNGAVTGMNTDCLQMQWLIKEATANLLSLCVLIININFVIRIAEVAHGFVQLLFCTFSLNGKFVVH